MPPKINTNRTNIQPAFIELMQKMYADWIDQNTELIQNGRTNKRWAGFTQTAQRMIPIIRGVSPAARTGLDYEITRLRGLPFTDFTVIYGPEPVESAQRQEPVGKIRWMVGRTRHVTATYYNRRNDIAGELGRYDIYIPETMARYPDLACIHMIPQRNQLAVNRHYHHYLYTGDEKAMRHPLSYPTGNCWGDYTGPIKGLLDVPDYPELFRQLYNHLSTYGDRPPRTRLDFPTTQREA